MKVVCFDFDDVLTSKSTLMKLSRLFGSKFGELKYAVAMLEDNKSPEKYFRDVKNMMRLLKGVRYEYVERIGMMIGLSKGSKNVLKRLKAAGYRISIVSTNDEGLIRRFLEKNNISQYVDHVYASRFVARNGVMTGEIRGESVRTEKVGVVRRIEKAFRAARKDIIYIGDGMTDLPIMKRIGRGILFNPNAITVAEVVADRKLRRMKDSGDLLIVKGSDMSKVLNFID